MGPVLIVGAFLSTWVAVPAHAQGGPLLVVVEAPPELSVDAGEIRRAIGTELQGATIAPARLVSDTSERALVVSVDRERITMSLRQSTAVPVTRAIPAPGDRAARLHAIAWLAGNLARDQVSGIVAESAGDAALASMPALAPEALASPARAAARPHTQPPADQPGAGQPDTQPPPLISPELDSPIPSPPADQPGAAPVLATKAPPPAASAPPRWFVSLEAGAVVGVYTYLATWGRIPPYNTRPISTLWRLELRRFTQDRRFLLGVSAEGITGYYNPEEVGAAGFCGWSRRRGKWDVEATLGLGLDVGLRQFTPQEEMTSATESSSTGSTTTTFVTGRLGGAVYGMAAAAVSRPVGESANLFIRVGAHVSTVEPNDMFVWTALGISYGLW